MVKNLLVRGNISRGFVVQSGCEDSTFPIARRAWGPLAGIELKSPQTNIGMSTLTTIFCSPLRRV